jgi:hypothetical protein
MKRQWTILAVLLIVIIAIVLIAINFQAGVIRGGSATIKPTTRRAIALSRPTTRPSLMRKLHMPWIASPPTFGKSSDPALNRLIEGHNQLMDRLSDVVLRGNCVWEIDGPPGEPRPMVIEFHRAKAEADVTCGPQRGTVSGATLTMPIDSAVNMDCMYLIGLRKFDPAKFKIAPGAAATEGALVATSDTEKLMFDVDSGKLLGCDIQTPNGTVQARFQDVLPLGKDGAVSAPTVIELTIPRKVYTFKVQDDFGKATFTIEPAKCEIRK